MNTPIAKLLFPAEYQTHKYSLIHFNFFVQYARVAGIDVELVDSGKRVFISEEHLIFSCLLNDQQIIIDYADHSTKNWKHLYPELPYFKFQTNLPIVNDIIPLGPPMIGVKKIGTKGATLREYNQVKWNYNYLPGTSVLCKQLPNGAAIERRNLVHKILKENFDDVDIFANDNQLDFWQAHESCLAAVCVPGATNNMVDRGHMELMGLGVCTISPELRTVFPWIKLLEPGKHYIKCQDDYSDLVEIIQSLQTRTDFSKQIGNNAREFYDEYYSPKKYWQWILENLS